MVSEKLELDLSKVRQLQAQDEQFGDLEYALHVMKSHRDDRGHVSGYLVKTAQSLTTF